MANIDSRLLESRSTTEIDENFFRVLTIVDGDNTNVTADIEALFALAKVSVTFDSDGGSAVSGQLIPYDSKATEPDDPTKEDYTFDGWLLGEEEFDFDTKLKADTVLVAAWVADETPDAEG